MRRYLAVVALACACLSLRADVAPNIHVTNLECDGTVDFDALISCDTTDTDADGTLTCGIDDRLDVEESDATFLNTITTIDFRSGFDLSESPVGELNVVLDYTEDPVILSGSEVTGILACTNFPALVGSLEGSAGSCDVGIAAGAVGETQLNIVNSPTDEYCLENEGGGNQMEWEPCSTGDVTGPSSSVDNSIVRFDGAGGKNIQGYTSGAPIVSDTGLVTIGDGSNATNSWLTVNGGSGANDYTLRYDSGLSAYVHYPGAADWYVESGVGSPKNIRVQAATGSVYIGAPGSGDIMLAELFQSASGGSNLGSVAFHRQSGIDAAGTTQGTGTVLSCQICEVDTVVLVTAFALKAPTCDKIGRTLTVINNDADQLSLFPGTGEDLGAGTNAAITVAGLSTADCWCYAANTWRCTVTLNRIT